MTRGVRSKPVAILLIFSFILFYSPHVLKAQGKSNGNLIGFVYDKDGTTPLEGAVVEIRNVSTGAVHESSKTDKLGIFKIEGIDRGLYVVGLSLKEGDFNVENLIGIRAGETGKVSIALKPMIQEGADVKKDKRCPRGDWYIPEVEGECDEGYVWNPEKKRCECKKRKGFAAFFATPLGIALIIAATSATVYGVVTLVTPAEESPFKK